MFPAEYQDKVLARSNVKELNEIVRQKAINYFKLTDEGDKGSSDRTDKRTTEPMYVAVEGKDGQEEKDGQPKTDTGTYVGLIDNNSIEIMISGVPPEKAARAFRLSDKVKAGFENLALKEGEQVLFKYFVNGYDQMVITEIKRMTN